MHRVSRALPAIALALFGLQSCSLFDRAEPAPAYIRFDSARVLIDTVSGFTTNLGLRDIWVYQGDDLQGTYPINPEVDHYTPVVPVIPTDQTNFFLEGGIYESGQSAFHIAYPFWDPISFNATLTPLDTLVIMPVFEYMESRFYDIKIDEYFEGGSFDFVPFSRGLTEPDTTNLRLRNIDVFHGTGIGYADFGTGDRYLEVVNSNPFDLIRGNAVFAEITYKGSIPLSVGLVYTNANGTGSVPVLTISPSPEWNTVYINFVEQVRGIINTGGEDTDFWLWLFADGAGAGGYIQLDDVRVLHMK